MKRLPKIVAGVTERRFLVGWASFVVALLFGVSGFAIALATARPGSEVPTIELSVNLLLLPFGTVGALVASRRPENPIGWLFCLVGLLLGLDAFSYAWVGLAVDWDLPGAGYVAFAGAVLTVIPLFIGPLILLLLFPDGRLPSRRWRPVAWLVGLLTVGVILLILRPGPPLDDYPDVANPFAVHGWLGRLFDSLDPVLALLVSALFLAATASQILRLRRSHGQERLQIKWVVYAACLTAVAFAFTFLAPAAVSDVAFWFGLVGLGSVPAAAGVAILRYRLYEIDRVINRTLVYAALTATLVAIYLVSVLLLQLALDPVTSGSSFAVAVSTLAVAALFRPARAQIQAVVDKRFYRRRYDAEQTLEGFSARLREQVDLDALGGELRAVVVDTMQPAHVSLWLRPPPLRRP